MKNWSLKWQILLLVLSSVSAAVLSLVVLTISQIADQLDESLERKVISISSILARNVGPGLDFQDSAYVAEVVEAAFADPDVEGVAVFDADMRQVYRKMVDPRLYSFQDTCNYVAETEMSHEGGLFLVEQPILLNGRQIGCLWTAVSEDAMLVRINRSIIVIVTLATILLALTVIVGLVVSRRVVKPIHTFEAAATRISSGDMESSIDLRLLHRDFVPLGTAFNDMQDGLAEAFRQLNESHDQLESQVAERTQELRKELDERSRTEAEKRARLDRIQRQRAAITRLTTDETVTGSDFDRSARAITEIVAGAIGVGRVSLWLMDAQDSAIKCVDLYELANDKHSSGTVLKASGFPAYFGAIETDRVLAASDARTDPRTSEFNDCYLIPLGITSRLDAAIRVSGKLVGIICFEHIEAPRTWLTDEMTFADEIAAQVAQMYANAERRRAQVANEEGQELLRATLESTADGILVVDQKGEATHANARFAQMWRIPADLMVSRDDNKLLAHVLEQLTNPEAFIAKVQELYRSAAESLDLLNFKDGRIFERFSCPLIQNNAVVGRVWSFRDITERGKAEEKLRQSQQRLLLHAQQTPLGVIEWDLDFKVVEWNQAAEKIFGYTREEAIGRHAAGLVAPEHYRQVVEQTWIELLTRRGGTRSTNDNVTKSGRLLTCEWYNTPLVDDTDKVIGVASLVQDVTEQTQAQKARAVLLKVSEAANQTDSLENLLAIVRKELGTVIDTENFYVALYDPENDLYSFPYHRDKYETDDYQPPQALRKSLTDYVRRTGETLLADEGVHEELKERGEAEMVGPPSRVWLGIPLRTSVGTIGVMVVQNYVDPMAYRQPDADWLTSVAEPIARVIERMQAGQQERELREQLERAERMESLGVLAGGVAHDLNNMLGPLVGYPELMLMKLPEDSPLRKQVQRISNSARGAAEVVQDLLTLARRGRYNMVPTDITATVEEYLDSPSYHRLSQSCPDVTVELSLGQDLGRIQGSAAHLSKVVMNLIVNAFDAMPEGGGLSVATSQCYLETLLSGYEKITPGDYILLRVRDTGIGIEAKDIEKIFEPYYSKKKMGTSGSGLGLSVVYGVVKDHKGYYDILSAPGEGAEFVLYFPVAAVSIEASPQSTTEIGGGETVLVIDDDEAQREMALELVGSLGYHVDTVANGQLAIEHLREKPVDIILLDMIMEPDFDGLDTYREIIKLYPGQKAIIVSGYSSTDRMIETHELGAGALVKKPYTRDIIGTAIRNELKRIPDSSAEQDQSAAAPA